MSNKIKTQKKRKRKLILRELTKYGIIEKDGIVEENTKNKTRDKNKRINEIKSKEIDVIIGKNIMLRRKSTKMSLTALADLVGVSHQQLNKYEKGINRISSSTLFIVSNVLRVPVGVFYMNIENIYKKEQTQDLMMKMMEDIYSLKEKERDAVENLIINLK